jgi:hypothetical protein
MGKKLRRTSVVVSTGVFVAAVFAAGYLAGERSDSISEDNPLLTKAHAAQAESPTASGAME